MLHAWVSHHLLSLHGLMVILGLGTYVIASHARRQRRHPSAAIAWVVLLALLPYIALPLYLLFGNRKVLRGQPLRLAPATLSTDEPGDQTTVARFQHLAGALGVPPAASYRQLAIHDDGQAALTALRAVIMGATRTLDLCTFLMGRDALGQEITTLLMHKARGGVRVRFLIDGIGVYLGGRPPLRALKASGVQVALFVSPWRSPLPGRTNLRNHRKLVIADGVRLWTGGRNLAAEYFVGDLDCQKTPWIDLSFDLRGELVRQTQARFDQDWAFATRGPRPAAWPVPQDIAPVAKAACRAQLIASGPDQADDTLYALLVASCFNAQTRILAVTPYFVPDATLLMALTLAARRGVAVDLILPAQSNHRLADLSRHAALREMSQAGARVWLAPRMVHAKAIVIDSHLALVGSANLDERSLFLNYELMVAFDDPADVRRFAQWAERPRAGAALYRAQAPGVVRGIAEGLIRWLAFQL
ncbi:MAG: PLDc N-terminal domain-containing protein [Massilia sp.]|nr:PLDc N-terminal domain-containing protein [Aquabacterium sp.]